MILRLSFLSVLLTSLITCTTTTANSASQNDPSTSEPASNTTVTENAQGTVYLKNGENKFLKSQAMNITFKGISEDSRCPEGVNCIWSGVAVAEVELMGLATRPMTVSLATINMPSKNYSKSAVFNGYKIELKELLPAKREGEMKSEEYKIGVTVTKLAGNQTENSTGGTTTR